MRYQLGRLKRPVPRSVTSKMLTMNSDSGVVLRALPTSTTEISLRWDNSLELPGDYRIEVSTDGVSFTTLVASLPNTDSSYVHTGLSESVQRYYKVIGVKGGADLYASNIANSWTVPATPTGLSATAISSSQINLAWTDVSTGNTGQIVERRTPPTTGTYSVIATVGATTAAYNDETVSAGVSYEYQVAATNPATQSAYSTAASATTPASGPTAAWTLDFSSGTNWSNGTTYNYSSTRTGGSFTNSSGYVQFSGANEFQYSEDPANVYWTKTNTTIGNNGGAYYTAPDGSATGVILLQTTVNAARGIQLAVSATARCYSVYLKAGNTTGGTGRAGKYAVLIIRSATTDYYYASFDLSAGTVVTSATTGTVLTGAASGIESVGDGWYRCWVRAQRSASGSMNFHCTLCTNDSNGTPTMTSTGETYTGANTTDGFYIWGFQQETRNADPLPYSKTTTASNGIQRLTHSSSGTRLGLLVEESRTNLCHRSELIDLWTLSGVTVTANSTAAPDNTTTADTLVENTAAGNHRASSNTATVTANQVRTATCYVKAAGRDYCSLTLYGTGGTTSRFCQVFDLTGAGSLGSTNTANSPTNTGASITDVGNGWFRIMAQMQSSDTSCQIAVGASDSATPTFASAAPTYTGNGANALYVWGGQLEDAATATTYIPTPSTASVTRSADLAHVLDTKITSWGDPGALVVHFYPPGQAGTLLSTDDVANEQLGIQANTVTQARAFWSSGNTNAGTIGTGVQKAVHYWNGTNSRFCINGGTVESSTNNITTFGNIDFVTLGAEATDSSGVPGTFSQYANCIIRKVEFYSGTLTDANLQTITT